MFHLVEPPTGSPKVASPAVLEVLAPRGFPAQERAAVAAGWEDEQLRGGANKRTSMGGDNGSRHTKVQVAGPPLADDFVVVAVLRQHALVARPEGCIRGHYEGPLAVRATLH